MSIELYPSVAKVKRGGVYQNLPGFVPESGADAAQAMIANEETTSTAQYTHATGSYFRLNGTLYEATEDIRVNDAIVVGTNCKVAVLGNDVAELKSDLTEQSAKIDITNNDLYPSDGVSHTWIQGSFNRTTGANASTNAAVRESGSIYHGDYYKFTCKTGYKMALWAWDIASGSFVGHVQENGVFGTGTTYKFFTEIYLNNFPTAYRYRITLHKNNTAENITVSEGAANVTWHKSKIQEIENAIEPNTVFANNPVFSGSSATIFANDDANKISGVDDGLLNSVNVIKISDAMYFMYYESYAANERGYENARICFAYSTDGTSFTKGFPTGITPPISGTNMVLAKGTTHGVCVVKVQDVNYPFRMIGVIGTDSNRPTKMWKSADGINWVLVRQITEGYNDSFTSCVVRGNLLKIFLRSRDENGRVICVLLTDIDGNRVSLGWNQKITLDSQISQLYQASASILDDKRELLLPTVYNPNTSAETVSRIILDGNQYAYTALDTSSIIDSSVKSIYFASGIVNVGYKMYAFYTTRSTDHEHFSSSTKSAIKRIEIVDSTLPDVVTPT